MELLLEILIQFAIEALFGALAGLFSSDLDERLSRTVSSFALLVLFGAGLGWLSTLVFPEPFLRSPQLRLGWLVASPLVGGSMVAGFRVLLGDAFRWKKFFAGAAFIGCLELARYVALS